MFSKDRAMQADAVLSSFFLHCLDAAEIAQIHVIYKTTSEAHQAQYQQLAQTYPKVSFIQQSNFRADMLNLINPYTANHPLYQLAGFLGRLRFRAGTQAAKIMHRIIDIPRYKIIRAILPSIIYPQGILFLVDDNLFVRDFSLQPAMNTLNKNPNALGFSLRLGCNTTYCYTLNKNQPAPPFSRPEPGMLQFRWVEALYDFNYPLEVSSSIYLETTILPLLLSAVFGNPNELENAIASRKSFFSRSNPVLLCFEQSVTFCNPINLVQSTHSNRAGEQYPYNIDTLLYKFEQGERVDVKAYNNFTPNACHQEVKLYFNQQKQVSKWST